MDAPPSPRPEPGAAGPVAALLLASGLLLPAGPASWALGVPERVQAVLEAVRHNKPGDPASLKASGAVERTFELSEADINAFLAGQVQDKVKEVRRASVRLPGGRAFEAEASVAVASGALDKLDPGARGLLRRTLESLLKAENTVSVEGIFTSAKGKGSFQLRRVSVNGIPLRDAWVRDILKFAGERQRPPVDFNGLFPLPNGLQKIELLPGAVRARLKALP